MLNGVLPCLLEFGIAVEKSRTIPISDTLIVTPPFFLFEFSLYFSVLQFHNDVSQHEFIFINCSLAHGVPFQSGNSCSLVWGKFHELLYQRFLFFLISCNLMLNLLNWCSNFLIFFLSYFLFILLYFLGYFLEFIFHLFY